ncbi:MAG: T9SS type A sorting domain-containing protein [Bacteroidetes bacterium]|nr:T9SS type A sorting domain-containing protein [Bacteroidota bacterium]
MKLKTCVCIAAFILIFSKSWGQTFQTNGDWNTASNWNPASVPSGTGTDVTVNANPTISQSNTIGNITDGNSVTYTITGSGNLQVGASGTPKNMTFNNNGTVNVNSGGVLEIWGDLIVNNNLTLNVVGTLIVHGNVTMNNNAAISVSGGGGMTVDGNLTGQQNTHITIDGSGSSLNVTGSLSLGSGTSSIDTSNGGAINAGSCSCSSCGGGHDCGNVLPVTLLFFKGIVAPEKVNLTWSTASEINFDHFVLEKSSNGSQFSEIAQVRGSGTSNTRKDYSYTDYNPYIGRSYYRLTSVDFDGYTEVFNNNVVRVSVKEEKNFYIAPNPIRGLSLKAGINFDASETHLLIYDRMGALVGRYNVSASVFELQLPILPNGVYFAQLRSGEFTKTVRFAVNQ